MDLQSRKIEFVQEFLKLQNEELISLFEEVLLNSKRKSDGEVSYMTKERLNERIAQSEKDLEAGNYKTLAEVLSKYE